MSMSEGSLDEVPVDGGPSGAKVSDNVLEEGGSPRKSRKMSEAHRELNTIIDTYISMSLGPQPAQLDSGGVGQ